MISVLSVASEAYPLVKTGGLADVVGALPAALAGHGVKVTTLLPGYSAMMTALKAAQPVHHYDSLLGESATLLKAEVVGHPWLVLDAPALFRREGGLYGDTSGKDWPDNWKRFAALARAAADLASGVIPGHAFDILHCHDWQGALAPAYLHFGPIRSKPAASIITIHNIAFQGRFDAGIFPSLGLPQAAYDLHGVEYYGGVGFLKAGLALTDAITTVSPGYAAEIQKPEFGMGLEGLIRARAAIVTGILNGIDTGIWNPTHDPLLAANYDEASLERRQINKRALEQRFGLERSDGPLFSVTSRLTWQKGMDILAGELDGLVNAGGRLALLGSGEPALEATFREAAGRHPGHVGLVLGYDEALAHQLQGGADAILIPSRFEPCGLTQLYGLAYGCVPVATRTGGLGDTIIDANDAALAAGAATGVLAEDAAPATIRRTIARAIALYSHPPLWRAMQLQGMRCDFSWQRAGYRYAALYGGLV
ncbi:MAG: glycogen synthase GlgA [Alphaproteobacteria bacterium]|nr:glycogen synthase GlgA [Alphaproteobacteria bacterium]